MMRYLFILIGLIAFQVAFADSEDRRNIIASRDKIYDHFNELQAIERAKKLADERNFIS